MHVSDHTSNGGVAPMSSSSLSVQCLPRLLGMVRSTRWIVDVLAFMVSSPYMREHCRTQVVTCLLPKEAVP